MGGGQQQAIVNGILPLPHHFQGELILESLFVSYSKKEIGSPQPPSAGTENNDHSHFPR